MVEFYDPIKKENLSYHIDKKLQEKWDRLKGGRLIKKDEDRCYIVDGRERTGKSVFTFQQAKYIDPTFNLDRICFTPEEFLNQIRNAPAGSVIVFDEAFRGLSSKASQSKVNKRIVQAMMEMGQKNLIVFIVLPTIFLLELYPAVLRSESLFHIYKDKNGKRAFKIFNYQKKSTLYKVGKKRGFSYSFPKTKSKGRFFGTYAIDEISYRKKKMKSLKEIESIKEDEVGGYQKRFERRIAILFKILNEKFKLSQMKIAELCQEYGEDVNNKMVSIYLSGKCGEQ